ncbi:SDR family NAD(P)-dependent oxidoreductase [Actinokineospora terrae]|uniref:Short-chain dehydrogenase n=1 Tax=Actinokineospora terrae TaxID=155974 RepID=A0A1H9XRD6_9PSEU|nr:SDR family NAD(P)-dependent oxidoreductase [Actinokineospora terrae]SES48704.1 Short-chain dehydrogenase [Actinokineospora terrae]
MRSAQPPLALVTGATSDIGREVAGQFAARDFHVVLVADDPAVHAFAADLDAPADAFQLDLGIPDSVDALVARIGVPAAVAINATTQEHQLAVTDSTVRATVHLTDRLLPAMIDRAYGRLLFTSSGTANQPVHKAARAFVSTYAAALREELRGTGLTVTALGPESHPARAYQDLMAGRAEVAPETPFSKVAAQLKPERLVPAALRIVANARSVLVTRAGGGFGGDHA